MLLCFASHQLPMWGCKIPPPASGTLCLLSPLPSGLELAQECQALAGRSAARPGSQRLKLHCRAARLGANAPKKILVACSVTYTTVYLLRSLTSLASVCDTRSGNTLPRGFSFFFLGSESHSRWALRRGRCADSHVWLVWLFFGTELRPLGAPYRDAGEDRDKY